LDLEADLFAAADRGELELVYSAREGFDATAASVRWRHSRRGVLEGPELLSLAEESGLARDLGRWTLHQACAEARKSRGTTVSVALSNSYLDHAAVVDDIRDALHDSGLPAAQLLLQLDRCDANQVQALHALGVIIVIGELALQ